MNNLVTEFSRQIEERDDEIAPDQWDWENRTLPRLYEGKRCRFFDGSSAEKIETVAHYSADYKGDVAPFGEYDVASGEEFVVEWTRPGYSEPVYFKVRGYHDSWDNGKPDAFTLKSMTQVKKVMPVKHTWEEVK